MSNKTQNSSAGRALFWTFLYFHLPTLNHKQVSWGWSERAYALNKHQFSFFPILFIQIHLERTEEQLWVLFSSSQNCVTALFHVLGIILVFLCTQVFVVNLHLCCTFKSASCSLAFKNPLLLLENNIIATKGIVIIILEIRFYTHP